MSDQPATTTDRWPLNESQRRALAVRLAGIDRDLRRLLDVLEHPPAESRMTRYVDPLTVSSDQVRARIAPIQRDIQQMADELRLPFQEEAVRRSLRAALLLDEVGLEEITPSRLRGYGDVDAATADYLDRRLSRLRALLQQLRNLLDDDHGRTEVSR